MLGPEGREVMDSLKEELERRLPDHEDRGSILSGLVRAVVTEEVARQTITKQPMISGQVTDIDKNSVVSRWKCLAEHPQPKGEYDDETTGTDHGKCLPLVSGRLQDESRH